MTKTGRQKLAEVFASQIMKKLAASKAAWLVSPILSPVTSWAIESLLNIIVEQGILTFNLEWIEFESESEREKFFKAVDKYFDPNYDGLTENQKNEIDKEFDAAAARIIRFRFKRL